LEVEYLFIALSNGENKDLIKKQIIKEVANEYKNNNEVDATLL